MGCGTLGITIISPALGLVTNDFGVDEATGQWVLSAYFGAIALVQLFYGPLSDRFGRKIPLLSGLTLYGLGGFLGAYAPSIETLIAARVIQGLGGGSIISIIRAIINDSFKRLDLPPIPRVWGPVLPRWHRPAVRPPHVRYRYARYR